MAYVLDAVQGSNETVLVVVHNIDAGRKQDFIGPLTQTELPRPVLTPLARPALPVRSFAFGHAVLVSVPCPPVEFERTQQRVWRRGFRTPGSRCRRMLGKSWDVPANG